MFVLKKDYFKLLFFVIFFVKDWNLKKHLNWLLIERQPWLLELHHL
jgi:hypothetical protein